ncbi:hypothetical protein [Paenibacillus sp. JDR-2]|uniref:hypothetical protein n=1 Tax=Paenibacillus sp. (strain JDR-2) TaxID=324057 RepID=UPI0001663AFD|nr:hypothetical protein [Paenibacillus sp. JDR-2]ACT00913.1 hypothetical protein Pjdr2_2257 [Paenibacillus sp. JDR-2]
MKTCGIDDCSKPVKARDLCSMHHQRLMRHGDPNTVMPRRTKKLVNCSWINCSSQAVSKGLCVKHYYINRVLKKNEQIDVR